MEGSRAEYSARPFSSPDRFSLDRSREYRYDGHISSNKKEVS